MQPSLVSAFGKQHAERISRRPCESSCLADNRRFALGQSSGLAALRRADCLRAAFDGRGPQAGPDGLSVHLRGHPPSLGGPRRDRWSVAGSSFAFSGVASASSWAASARGPRFDTELKAQYLEPPPERGSSTTPRSRSKDGAPRARRFRAAGLRGEPAHVAHEAVAGADPAHRVHRLHARLRLVRGGCLSAERRRVGVAHHGQGWSCRPASHDPLFTDSPTPPLTRLLCYWKVVASPPPSAWLVVSEREALWSLLRSGARCS